ncbi:MAG TPA: gas vesicle protein GvpO [Acidimicrobiales bacterium]|nr:gas vesicle protein GvpO [Acidimicrobiales bacterium]
MTEVRRRPRPASSSDGGGRSGSRPQAADRSNGHRPAGNDSDDNTADGDGRRRRRARGADAIRVATSQLVELTGRPVDGVSRLARSEDGWCITLEVVELERIPRSTDVLGRYEVVVDDEGELLEYRRVDRYVRSQPGDD